MSKTPISILQELMVQRKLNIPDYYIENGNIQEPPFKCTVKAGSVKAVGFGTTKKDAKQNSAKEALEMLGFHNVTHQQVVVVNSLPKNAAFINYVGKLNELASTHGKPYPTYYDDPIPYNGIFITRCDFLNFHSEGHGLKKKDAKQDAARNMLEKLRNEDLSIIAVGMQIVNLEKEKNIETLTQEIIKSYEKLTVTCGANSETTTTIPSIPNLKKKVATLEDFEKELKKYGYRYTIETFQKNPWILMMTISDTGATIMGKGDTKDKALDDLLEKVLLMFEHGFSLKTVF